MHFMHELYMACEGDLYTLDTAAARLGMSKWQLLNHIGLGNIRFINVGIGKHNDYRFTEAMLDEFAARSTQQNQPNGRPRKKTGTPMRLRHFRHELTRTAKKNRYRWKEDLCAIRHRETAKARKKP